MKKKMVTSGWGFFLRVVSSTEGICCSTSDSVAGASITGPGAMVFEIEDLTRCLITVSVCEVMSTERMD